MSRLTDRAPTSRPSRDARPSRWLFLRRRIRRALRPVIWSVLAAVLLIVSVTLMRGVQSGGAVASLRERIGRATHLTVADIQIEGRSMTPEGQLRNALGVAVGDPLLGFSLEDARARIERLTWVQHATVERRLPGSVMVQLTERRPFAVWQSGGKFVLIDRAGQPVAEQDPVKDAAAFSLLPLVVGPGAPEAAAALLDHLASIPALKSRVVAAVRVGERRWNLRLNSGCDVLLPEGQEMAAMTRLMELQAAQAVLDRPLQTLDMRAADRLVVRPGEPREPRGIGPRRPT